MGDVAKAIGASEKCSSSQYATFETKNGKIVTIRLANHNASTKRMDNAEREEEIAAATNQEIEQEEGAEGGTAAPTEAQQVRIPAPRFSGARITLDLPNGSSVNGVVLQETDDGVEVQTSSPVNGRFVQVFPTDEFDGMLSSVRDEADNELWRKGGVAVAEEDNMGTENDNDSQPLVISTSPRWGKVYQWGKGRFKEAVDFLMKKKDGILKGVFYRKELGEISIGWGQALNDFNGRGLVHIIRKHVNKFHDFNSVDEMVRVVDDVINHGVIRKDNNNSYAIENDTYRVIIVKDEDGAWVLSAFDYVHSKKEKAKRKDTAALGTPGQSNVEAGAVTPNLSLGKDTPSASTSMLS